MEIRGKNIAILPLLFIALTILLDIKMMKIEHGIIFTSFAATAFIIYLAEDANNSSFVYAHLIGLICGLILSYIGNSLTISTTFTAAIGVTFSSLLMKTYGVEYPPANGTCLGALLNGCNISVLSSIFITLFLVYLLKEIYVFIKNHRPPIF